MERLAEGMEDVNVETLEALGEDTEFRQLALRMSGGGGDARRALTRLEAMSMAESDPKRRTALQSMALQARRSIDRNGRVGSEFVSRVMSPRMQDEIRAAQREMRAVGGEFASIGGQLETITESAQWFGNQTISEALSGVGAQFMQGNVEAANQGVQQFVTQAASLDPRGRSRMLGDLARVRGEGSEQAEALMAQISNQAQIRESLIGRGRGGRRRDRQRMETAMQLAGGFGMGRDFSFVTGEGDRERVVGGTRAQRALQRALRSGVVTGQGMWQSSRLSGGAAGREEQAALEAYATQLQEGGMDAEMRREVMGAMGQMGTAQTQEERTAAADRMQGLRRDPRFRDQFRAIDERQQRQTAQAMRNRNPLDADRNDMLRDIREAVRRSAEQGEGNVAEGEGGD
jgi:hypothetical protein